MTKNDLEKSLFGVMAPEREKSPSWEGARTVVPRYDGRGRKPELEPSTTSKKQRA